MKDKNKTEKKTKKLVNNNQSLKKVTSNKKKLVEIPPLTNIANEQIDFASNIFKLYSCPCNYNNEENNKTKEKNQKSKKTNQKNIKMNKINKVNNQTKKKSKCKSSFDCK